MDGSFSFPHRSICITRQISEYSEDQGIILPLQTLIIGDIHGCFVEMQELLAAAGLSDGDTILATGDIVDRGPETPEVLRFFATQPNARSVAGNHERKHIRSFAHEIRPALSQVITKEQIGESYPTWVAFMASFPVYIDLPEALLVHAYFEPGIEPENQQIPVVCGHMAGEIYLKKKI
jgi:serine/threonine protein phosphatase 1